MTLLGVVGLAMGRGVAMRRRFKVNAEVVVVAVPTVGVKVVVEVTASAPLASSWRAAFVYGQLSVSLPALVMRFVVVQMTGVARCVERVLVLFSCSQIVPG